MSGPEPKDFLLGYAVEVVNPELEIELLGLPQEVVDELHTMGRAVAEVMAHPRTRIRSSRVFKDFPELVIPGGPHAEVLMDLMIAVEEADAESTRRLVGDNPELAVDELTGAVVPLITAVARGLDNVVQVLAEAGVGLNGDAGMGMTSLHWAALLGSPAVVRELLQAGAAADRWNWLMVSPAELARANGRRDVERLLVGRFRRAKVVSPQETVARMIDRSEPTRSRDGREEGSGRGGRGTT